MYLKATLFPINSTSKLSPLDKLNSYIYTMIRDRQGNGSPEWVAEMYTPSTMASGDTVPRSVIDTNYFTSCNSTSQPYQGFVGQHSTGISKVVATETGTTQRH